MGGKGVFIKELEDALLDGSVDLAVHSMKDVPTELPAGLVIAAMCRARGCARRAGVARRAGFRAVAAGRARGHEQPAAAGAVAALPRRTWRWSEIRGNVDTRLAKVARGDYDAIVLAKAGLDRLGMADRITEVLSTDICLPAAGQGAMGIEARDERC